MGPSLAQTKGRGSQQWSQFSLCVHCSIGMFMVGRRICLYKQSIFGVYFPSWVQKGDEQPGDGWGGGGIAGINDYLYNRPLAAQPTRYLCPKYCVPVEIARKVAKKISCKELSWIILVNLYLSTFSLPAYEHLYNIFPHFSNKTLC